MCQPVCQNSKNKLYMEDDIKFSQQLYAFCEIQILLSLLMPISWIGEPSLKVTKSHV